ncbi:hypothetical protein CEXT_621641 [Caerostris extrusa]|uniref:Uncharacterized protein n=1 Tax=Caerostris extrusa TaxID=172846 RepID=A0AAV4XDE7_CAEEX|nr:hypothetical protein CEXT_621641 [Caerostris extrusa]
MDRDNGNSPLLPFSSSIHKKVSKLYNISTENFESESEFDMQRTESADGKEKMLTIVLSYRHAPFLLNKEDNTVISFFFHPLGHTFDGLNRKWTVDIA